MKSTAALNDKQMATLAKVAVGAGCCEHLGTLKALRDRGLVKLSIRTVKQYLHGTSTDVTVDLTDAGRAAL